MRVSFYLGRERFRGGFRLSWASPAFQQHVENRDRRSNKKNTSTFVIVLYGGDLRHQSHRASERTEYSFQPPPSPMRRNRRAQPAYMSTPPGKSTSARALDV